MKILLYFVVMITSGDIYQHHKHDPSGLENNYTYKIIDTAFDAEKQEKVVIYKPLYDCEYKLFTRSRENFLEIIKVNNQKRSRFVKIKSKA